MNLEDRVTALERRMEAAAASLVQGVSRSVSDQAHGVTLTGMVKEMAHKLGLTSEQFSRAYQQRFAYWEQRFLESVEVASPSLAASIDRRETSSDASGEPYPPLFGS
jgi:hypothetical protein